jgi:hypothetical protein
MGMYDNINFEIECPKCKKLIKGFQSKDGVCMLETLDFWEVNNFYSSCSNCFCYIEFNIDKRPNRDLKIEDYDKSITFRGNNYYEEVK